ncbi:hypothetical protein RJ640_004308 [Escallonia rubra]|uniref:SCP domain-containing protein n=1 Tax=Escallonia rubra TaxID=112253 RepID=A0AA88UPD5_9ASTE|nr:hypothetical protein RJ640_004308 [Escallonia rubra]
MITNPTTTITQLLNAHNAVRARHRLPPLKWNAKLAKYAKFYANKRRGDCALVHSDSNYGENIFWGKGNGWKPADAVAAWAAQEAYYNYKSNTCMAGKDCLHYTQVVWRSTQSVGCAKIKCGNGDTHVVCEYYPHGNTIGQRPY